VDVNGHISDYTSHRELAPVQLDFSKYAAEHPGMEHLAGAPAGGTFIVVAEIWQGDPIADFALPYRCCAECGPIDYVAFAELDDYRTACAGQE
jgi:hypothetical protein